MICLFELYDLVSFGSCVIEFIMSSIVCNFCGVRVQRLHLADHLAMHRMGQMPIMQPNYSMPYYPMSSNIGVPMSSNIGMPMGSNAGMPFSARRNRSAMSENAMVGLSSNRQRDEFVAEGSFGSKRRRVDGRAKTSVPFCLQHAGIGACFNAKCGKLNAYIAEVAEFKFDERKCDNLSKFHEFHDCVW